MTSIFSFTIICKPKEKRVISFSAGQEQPCRSVHSVFQKQEADPKILIGWRIHNCYIINKNFAEKYIRGDGGQVVLSNGVTLDVSKRKKSEFLKAIGY
jgi:hypothetical protein